MRYQVALFIITATMPANHDHPPFIGALHIKSEQHNVPVLDHIFLAFDTKLVGSLMPVRFPASRDRHKWKTSARIKPFFKIGMNFTRCLRSFFPVGDGPSSCFSFPNRKIGNKTEQIISCMYYPVETEIR